MAQARAIASLVRYFLLQLAISPEVDDIRLEPLQECSSTPRDHILSMDEGRESVTPVWAPCMTIVVCICRSVLPCRDDQKFDF